MITDRDIASEFFPYLLGRAVLYSLALWKVAEIIVWVVT